MRVGLTGAFGRAEAAFRLVDLEVDARVVLHADDAQKGANRFGGVAGAADDLTHVFCIQIEHEQHTHLIYRAADRYVFRVIYQTFDNEFQKLLIFFYHRSVVMFLIVNAAKLRPLGHSIVPLLQAQPRIQP